MEPEVAVMVTGVVPAGVTLGGGGVGVNPVEQPIAKPADTNRTPISARSWSPAVLVDERRRVKIRKEPNGRRSATVIPAALVPPGI